MHWPIQGPEVRYARADTGADIEHRSKRSHILSISQEEPRMNMNTSRMTWISGFFAAALAAGCIGQPDGIEEPDTQMTDTPASSAPGEASEGDIQEPDTQTSSAADQAQEVVKLHMKAEDGTEADFLLPDGGSVKVTNEQLGIAYRLTGQLMDAEHLIVTVEQFNDIEMTSLNSTDVLYLDQGTESREQSAITPFSLRMIGLENQSMSESPGYKTQGDPSITCCVICSGWKVCCTPKPGYCCKVSTSCGIGCIVCN